MKVGQLRHVVTIQQIGSVTESSVGGRTPNWTTYAASVWALVEPTGGAEFWRGMKVEADVTHVVHLRHMASVTDAVTPAMRISFDSRSLYIQRVVNINEADRWLRLHCVEQVT